MVLCRNSACEKDCPAKAAVPLRKALAKSTADAKHKIQHPGSSVDSLRKSMQGRLIPAHSRRLGQPSKSKLTA